MKEGELTKLEVTQGKQHCTMNHLRRPANLSAPPPPPPPPHSILVVPDHLVEELLRALWLALWRDRSHFDRATHSAALSSGAAGRLLLL